jgi:hypothetical protein
MRGHDVPFRVSFAKAFYFQEHPCQKRPYLKCRNVSPRIRLPISPTYGHRMAKVRKRGLRKCIPNDRYTSVAGLLSSGLATHILVIPSRGMIPYLLAGSVPSSVPGVL